MGGVDNTFCCHPVITDCMLLFSWPVSFPAIRVGTGLGKVYTCESDEEILPSSKE